MKKREKLWDWVTSVTYVDSKTFAAIAEDFRKVGVTAIGVGLAGALLSSDQLPFGEAKLLLYFGVAIWVYGIILTKWCNQIEEKR